MKKSVLFIIPSLGSGGAEKGLITLLSQLNYEKYVVDLMLFRREGFFLEQVPPQVNVIDAGEDYQYFDGNFKLALLHFIKYRKFDLAAARIKYMLALKKEKSINRSRLIWKYLSRTMPIIEKPYDISIGYLEGNSIYFCVDKSNSHMKIGYIHSDYAKLDMDAEFDKSYFASLNKLVTISNTCAESLIRVIPSVINKTIVIENIVSKEEILRLAKSEPVFDNEFSGTVLLTVGRISQEKGIDIAVNACALLVSEGYNIKWYVIGAGTLMGEIETLIKEKDLEKHFILMGQQENPYKYMAQCDIYIQPSRYEGKSIAIEEAKILAKPIVTTNFTTVRDQIDEGISGIIAEINPVSLADKIKLLIDSRKLRESLRENLEVQNNGNGEELNKFYTLLGD